MKKIMAILCVCIVTVCSCFAGERDLPSNREPRDYTFIIYPGSLQLFSMEQSDLDYQSAYRMLCRSVQGVFGHSDGEVSYMSFLVNMIWPFFTYAVSHEEGHRSILTNLGIGSISQPFFNENGAAYVKGVTDATLENLRSSDLPSFVRLNTAGIESDYMMSRRDERLSAFGQEQVLITYPDFVYRVASNVQYLVSDAIYGYFEGNYITLKEESDELERDIVGDDVLGAVHALFSPDSEYKRYVTYDDLCSKAKDFLSFRVAPRSLLNLLTPMLVMKPSFAVTDDVSVTGSAGYCLAPFGDFMDENVYVKYGIYNLAFYAREYENRNTWFPAFGLELYDFHPIQQISVGIAGHFWMEPEDLDFNTTTGVPGGAVKINATYYFPVKTRSPLQALGFNTAILYKTSGFLPETESHKQLFRITCGVTVQY